MDKKPVMRTLYPELAVYSTGTLAVDDLHSVYYEESGNREGIPVVYLHGGPGSGSNENHRRYFNPDKYRIIIFDQRGCNRSTPRGETRNNTTQHLIEDMETLREELGVDKWLVYGGSWGAALGLLYAQSHPVRVSGMILRGTFLARQEDLDWFIRHGDNRIFPDAWEDFIALIPENERDNLVEAYYSRVHGDDRALGLRAAQAWSRWAGTIATYLLTETSPQPVAEEQVLHEVLIETHYARHRYFIADNQILVNVDKLPAVPTDIIHGRRDLTCTLSASWALHKALPDSRLHIVREGGHLAGEPVLTDALVTATDEMARQLNSE
jgi:proline iminopeptidase